MKKGELSINVIIVAAIALLVLVIVSVIFMGRMGLFNRQQSDCLAVNGQCIYGDNCGETGMAKHPSAVCYGTDNKKDPFRTCCIMQTGQ